MRIIIGLILFWITVFGIKIFIENKCMIDSKFSFALGITIIGIIEFIFGILNVMKIGSVLLVLASITYLGLLIGKGKYNKKKILEYVKDPIHIVCFLVFIYITIIGLKMHITHYDNFSHWALIIKTMFQFDRLPNFENNYLLFKGYQPGSACFIYLVGLLCGKKEELMIVAHNYLIFSYLTVLLNYVGKDKKIWKIALIICFYIFIMTTAKIRFNNLLVDSLLAVQLIFGLSLVYFYKDNIKKAALYSLPISIYLLLVKNTGLIFAGIICLYILFLAWKQKQLKIGIKYTVVTGIVLMATLLIWQKHVSLVYGYWALESKHSLSTQNIMASLKALGKDNIILFTKMYIKHLFSLKNNITNIYLLVFNAVVALSAFLFKNKKDVFKFLLVLDGLYLAYYFILGLMYIFSMPWEEAKVFASYERYMMTIIVTMIGLFVFYVFNNYKIINKPIIVYCMMSLILLVPIYYRNETFLGLLGKDDYKGSPVEKFDKIESIIPLDKDSYYIYAPSSKGDAGLLYFISIYKLQKEDVVIIQDEEKMETIPQDTYLVLYDEVKGDKVSLDEQFTKVNEKVFTRKEGDTF